MKKGEANGRPKEPCTDCMYRLAAWQLNVRAPRSCAIGHLPGRRFPWYRIALLAWVVSLTCGLGGAVMLHRTHASPSVAIAAPRSVPFACPHCGRVIHKAKTRTCPKCGQRLP